jgi:hypothetical protein
VPFILNNATSIATGVLATSNIKVADILIRLLYVLWFFHCGSLATSIAYCGSRLIQTLISHLKNNNVNSERHAKLKAGIFKVIISKVEIYAFKKRYPLYELYY